MANWFTKDGRIPHHTYAKVVTGAVRISVGGKELTGLASVTEPSENSSGSTPVNTLNMNRPLEHVVGPYQGGNFTITLWESWYNTPYQELGFDGVTKFVDILNHEEFEVDFVTYRPDGSVGTMSAYGCRVTSPPKPGGNYDRGTTTRQITVPIAYTHLEYR